MDYSEVAKELGKRGGEKTKEIYGADHFKKMQEKSVKSRLRNRKKHLRDRG